MTDGGFVYKVKVLIYCFGMEYGFVNAEGKIDINRVRDVIEDGSNLSRRDIKKIIVECLLPAKDDTSMVTIADALICMKLLEERTQVMDYPY